MARLFGINFMRDERAKQLEEAEVNLGIARREMEDIGYRLLNPTSQIASGDMEPLDRNAAIKRGIQYWIKDPVVGRSIDLVVDYVIGNGIEMPQTDHPEVANVIADFWNDEDNKRIITSPEAQRQKLAELQIMGNVMPVAFVNKATGHVKLSDIPVTEVTEIIAHPENRKRHIYYRRNYTEQVYDFSDNTWRAKETKTLFYCAAYEQPLDNYRPGKVEEGVVFHWSLNRLSDGKFGNPPIMRILDWTRAYNEFMRARVSLMRALAMFAWQRKVKGNASDVRKIANAWANGQLATGGTPGEGAGVPAQYAATVSTNENVQWEQLKTDTGGAAAREDGRMIKGQVAVGGGFPMHYLGDIGGANLATATAMELPVQKMIEGLQGYIEGQLYRMIDFAIIQKIKAGELAPAKAGRFSPERLEKIGLGIEDMVETADTETDGDSSQPAHKTVEGHGDRGEYNYKIVMPAVLKRQISETVNAIVNMLKAVDPYAQNVDASRWALKHALEILDQPNPQAIVDLIFPPGYQYPNLETERGRSDTRGGDSSGVPDFQQAARKPPAESRVGAKGGKEARTADEAMEAAEGALLDLIDTMTAHVEGSKHGGAADISDSPSA